MKLINLNNKINTDDFLEANKGVFEKCMIIGYDNEECLRACYDGNLTNQEVVFLLECIKTQILLGE